MLDITFEDIGDGLDSPVRVPGKSFEILLGLIGTEIVEEQEGVILVCIVKTKGPFEMDSGPFKGWLT